MQDTKPSASQCHYPDCPAAAVKTCRQCRQGFCAIHIHRRWWSYICEFCLLLKAAGRFHRPLNPREDMFQVIDEVREKDEQEQIDELAD